MITVSHKKKNKRIVHANIHFKKFYRVQFHTQHQLQDLHQMCLYPIQHEVLVQHADVVHFFEMLISCDCQWVQQHNQIEVIK